MDSFFITRRNSTGIISWGFFCFHFLCIYYDINGSPMNFSVPGSYVYFGSGTKNGQNRMRDNSAKCMVGKKVNHSHKLSISKEPAIFASILQ
jgi:hypothetical protein